MTVLVAVKCSDGIVVGADSVATSATGLSPLVRIGPVDKIFLVGDRVLVASTGAVGLGQRFTMHVDDAWQKKLFQKSCTECAVAITTAACQDFLRSNTPRMRDSGFGFGALVAAPFGGTVEIVEFDLSTLQPETKQSPVHFVSMGSGQVLADPFLLFVNRVLWNNAQPTLAGGLLGIYWVLQHTIAVAPGGVGAPLKFGVLRREGGQWKARVFDQDDLAQVAEHIEAIEGRISTAFSEGIAAASASPPPPPPPPVSEQNSN